MSQSSGSSQRSRSRETRKRKPVYPDSPSSSQTKRRRNSKLSLKNSELVSQSSADSFVSPGDNDSIITISSGSDEYPVIKTRISTEESTELRSSTEVSFEPKRRSRDASRDPVPRISTEASSESRRSTEASPETRRSSTEASPERRRSSTEASPERRRSSTESSPEPRRRISLECKPISAKFNVNQETAKKHYEVFKKNPMIILKKVTHTKVLSNADLADPVEIDFKESPILGKRRNRKPKRRENANSSSLLSDSKNVDKSTQNFNNSTETSNLQPSSSKKKALNKRAESNITRYFQSFSSVEQNELTTPDTSPNRSYGLSISASQREKPKYNVILSDNSSDEFEISRTQIKKTKTSPERKKKELVSNPFTSSEIKTQVEHVNSNDSLKKKKKKIIRESVTEKSNHTEKESNEVSKEEKNKKYSDGAVKNESDVPVKETAAELNLSPPAPDPDPILVEHGDGNSSCKKVPKKRKRIKLSDASSSSGENTHEKSFNSITVNCEPLASLSTIKVDKEIEALINDEIISLPLPFGCETPTEDQEKELLETGHNDIDSEQGNLCIVSDEEQDFGDLNHLNSSLDMFDDLMDFGSMSPERKENESPSLEQPRSGDSQKSKGKPKIISISKVDNILIKNAGQDRYRQSPTKTSPKENIPNGSETPRKLEETPKGSNYIDEQRRIDSLESSSTEMKSDNVVLNPLSSNTTTPKKRGPKSALSSVKINLRNHESLKTPETKMDDEEMNEKETFKNICDNVVELSDSENTKTCKSDEKETSNKENKTEADQKSDDKSQGSENSADNNIVKFESIFKPTKSPKGRIPRLSLSLRRKAPEKSPTEVVSAPSTPIRPQHRQQDLANRGMSPGATGATQSSPMNTFPRRPNTDPRSNKTISPTMFSSPSGRDPRLNRSLSSIKTPEINITDPRLVRGQSRPKFDSSPERSPQKPAEGDLSNVVDPRLRKRREREEAEEAAKLAREKEEEERRIEREEAERAARLKEEEKEAERAAAKAKKLEEATIVAKIKRELDQQDWNDEIVLVSSTNGGGASPSTVQRRRSSIFERLGDREDSPDKGLGPEKELRKIIKSRKRSVSPTKSDDDALSLHANMDEWSSDEDSNNSSPRHRKFVNERTRQLEEAKEMQQQLLQQQQQQDLRKTINIKSRLSMKNNITSTVVQTTPRIPPPAISVRDRLGMTIQPVKPPVQERLGVNARRQLVQAPQATARIATGANPQFVRQGVSTLSNINALRNPAYDGNKEDDSYFKMNAEQMMQDVDNLAPEDLNTETYVTFGKDASDANTAFDDVSMLDGANEPAVLGMKKGLNDKNKPSFFKNYCFRLLRKGRCASHMTGGCGFRHEINILQMMIKSKKHELHLILEEAMKYNFEHFINLIWKDILPILEDRSFETFEQLYAVNIRSELLVHELFKYYFSKENVNHTIEMFVKKIAPIIESNDRDTVRTVCILIKNSLRDGFCWETIKLLGQKAVPPLDMVELTLLQCIRRKKNQVHIKEVYDMIKTRMGMMERNEINQQLLREFYNLVQMKCSTNNDSETRVTMPLMFGVGAHANSDINGNGTAIGIRRSQSIDSIKSADSDKESTRSTSLATKKSAGQIVQPNNSPVEVQKGLNKGESIREYVIGDEMKLQEPRGARSRDVFWQFFLKVDSVNKGLEKKDYEHVWRMLDEISQEKVPHELLKRAYFHILCKDIKKSQLHIQEIIKTAVNWHSTSVSQKSRDLLFEIGVKALIELGDNDLWVTASQLLDWMKIIKPKEPKTEFVFIAAEIYLANCEPLEALNLLQKTKVIRTNRDEWLVKDSLRYHEKHRNKLVSTLLKGLSFVNLERAVYLFKSLLADQAVLYYPIDLQAHVDKLVLLLMLHKEEEFVLEICRLAMDFDLTFQKPTYQELLAYLLPRDEVLANQILDYAIALGYYNDIRIRCGFTTIIIDMNYYEEEIYMMLKRLIRKLQINVGPVIPRLKPNQLRVILVFEDIPNDQRLYYDKLAVISNDKYRIAKNAIANILSTRFHPPIRVSHQKTGKFCKLISKTVVDYLKHWNK